MSKIQTASGRCVDPFDFGDEDFVLEDVIKALAHEARFGGHAGDWVVAQHLVLMWEFVRLLGGDAVDLASALSHDWAETWLKDIPKPVKYRDEMAFYREAEGEIMEAISRKAGVPGHKTDLVNWADSVSTYLEARKRLGRLNMCWTEWTVEVTGEEKKAWEKAYQLATSPLWPEVWERLCYEVGGNAVWRKEAIR